MLHTQFTHTYSKKHRKRTQILIKIEEYLANIAIFPLDGYDEFIALKARIAFAAILTFF